MTLPPPDGSRDRRIEDPTNLWLIHPCARALLPTALAKGISANAVSIAGLLLGTGAAICFYHWQSPLAAVAGLLLAIAWMIADGLDGMVARATGTASAFGRVLDGLCDHGVFVLIYLALGFSIGAAEAWLLIFAAGLSHAVQSSLYEGERARYHRRIKGLPRPEVPAPRNPMVRAYDWVATGLDRVAAPFDALFGAREARAIGADYGAAAAAPMRLLSTLSSNMRVWLLFVFCLVGRPGLFFWTELLGLSVVALLGITWHRRVEASLLHRYGTGRRGLSQRS